MLRFILIPFSHHYHFCCFNYVSRSSKKKLFPAVWCELLFVTAALPPVRFGVALRVYANIASESSKNCWFIVCLSDSNWRPEFSRWLTWLVVLMYYCYCDWEIWSAYRHKLWQGSIYVQPYNLHLVPELQAYNKTMNSDSSLCYRGGIVGERRWTLNFFYMYKESYISNFIWLKPRLIQTLWTN